MMRATVKNTFLELLPDVEEEESTHGHARARSTDPVLMRNSKDVCQMQSSNASMDVHLDQIGGQRMESDKQVGIFSAREQETRTKTPTVEELRALQRRLSELTGVRSPNVSSSPVSPVSKHQRTWSTSSMSTADMSDTTELSGKSSIRQVWSSGSVSTMVSEVHSEDFEEGRLCRWGLSIQAKGQEIDLSSDEKHSVGLGPMRFSSRHCLKDFSHNRVPRSVNLAEEFSKSDHEAPATTMMIRNIPNRYTQRELIKEVESLGFTGAFDFLYLPMDKATLCNVGYAFINFLHPADAARCQQLFEGYAFKRHRKARGKVATVSVAHIQGLEANARHYENAAVNGIMRPRQRGPVIMPNIANSLQVPPA